MELIQIAIVDDHQLFREGLAFIIEQHQDLSLTLEAPSGQELLDKLNKADSLPHVILMDLKMPDMDGIECTAKVKALYPDIKIIALSMYDQEDYILHALDIGANAYLPKHSSSQEVTKAIQTVYEKGFYFDDKVSQILLKGLKKKNIKKPKMDDHVVLTPREREILGLILKEYTTQEIANQLFISVRTVETHRKNIVDKFGARNIAGLVIKAIQMGYLEN